MKRIFTLILAVLCLSLTACAKEKDEPPKHSLVFEGEVLEEHTAPATVPEFPPAHGGTAVSHSLLENGSVMQEEITVSGAVQTGFFCNVMDTDGNLLLSLSPADDLKHNLSSYSVIAGDTFALRDAMTDDGGYIIVTTAGLCAYDTAGAVRWTIEDRDARDVILYEDNLLLLCGGTEETLYTVDPADGTRRKVPLTGEMQNIFGSVGDGDILFTGQDNALYTANDTGLYRITLTEKKKAPAAHTEQIAGWMSSGILSSSILSLTVENENSLLLNLHDALSGEDVFMQYTAVPPDRVPETEYIVLALLSTQDDYNLPVFAFNRQSENVQVLLKDYTVYEEDRRYLIFNADMAAGNVPDMVVMWQNGNTDNTISNYERADIFADLTPLMKEDNDFDYDSLLNYVTKPYQWDNGEQCLFPIRPQFFCRLGSEDVFDGPVTMDEYLDLCEAGGYAASANRRLFMSAMDDHYDERTAECTFNDGTLAAQMNRADSMKDNPNTMPTAYLSLPSTYLYAYAEQMMEHAGTMIPIGLPNADRALNVEDAGTEFFAVMKASANKAAAVDFLGYLMEENSPDTEIVHQEYIEYGAYFFSPPVGYTYRRGDIYKQLAGYDGKTLVVSGALVSLYDDDDPALLTADGIPLKLTEEHADAFCALLDGITRRVNEGSPVQRIFWEEFRAMEGRPVETMLDMLQSRVSIYLAEKKD